MNEIEEKYTMSKKLNVLLQLQQQYVLKQDKIMHSINTLLNVIDTESKIYDKLDIEINNIVNCHLKMSELESFILQFRAKELENNLELNEKKNLKNDNNT